MSLESLLEKIGIKKEKRSFTSHITLGRQVVLNEEFHKLKEKSNIDSVDIIVDKIFWMESTRINDELKYIPIYVKRFT
ncbi:2'-5' RNA ligase family protein [Gottschalkia acidurici]|uniref:2'-5' RNA ligase family protein n=1 Tax=Clostridium acidurici TaxID=1556 RepID=UPI00030323E7|nr:hypothetical protein [Gottschalkia acidurici]